MDSLDLLDYGAAADFLGLSEYTLRRYVSLGMLPHVKLGPKLVRIKPAELIAWLDSRAVPERRRGV